MCIRRHLHRCLRSHAPCVVHAIAGAYGANFSGLVGLCDNQGHPVHRKGGGRHVEYAEAGEKNCITK